MPSGDALWLQRDEATECSQCSMGDGVHHRVRLIEHMADTEDQTVVETEKEGRGLTMFMF